MEPPVQHHRETNQYISQSAGCYEHCREQEAPIEPTSLAAVDPGSVRTGHGQVLRDAAGRDTLQDLWKGRLFLSVTPETVISETSKQEETIFKCHPALEICHLAEWRSLNHGMMISEGFEAMTRERSLSLREARNWKQVFDCPITSISWTLSRNIEKLALKSKRWLLETPEFSALRYWRFGSLS